MNDNKRGISLTDSEEYNKVLVAEDDIPCPSGVYDNALLASMDVMMQTMGMESFSSIADRICRKYMKKPKVPNATIESKAEEKRRRKQLKRLEKHK